MTNEYNPDGKEIRFIDSHYKDLFHIPDGMTTACSSFPSRNNAAVSVPS